MHHTFTLCGLGGAKPGFPLAVMMVQLVPNIHIHVLNVTFYHIA
jgi:hypothetical protein